MYCRKCGKMVPDGQEYCDECRKLDIVSGNPDCDEKPPKSVFVCALVALIAALVVLSVSPLVSVLVASVQPYLKAIIAVLYAACVSPSVFLGIKTVVAYVRRSHDKKTRPVAALVLGIIALAASLSVISVSANIIGNVIMSAVSTVLPM